MERFARTVVMPAMIGNPTGEMASWHPQERPDTCAVVTQEFILEGLTGADHSESELRAVAEANEWYGPGGTPWEYMGKVLAYYGLPTERLSAWTTPTPLTR